MLQYQQFLQFTVAFFLTAAAVSDIKKREVPNWVNYGLVVTGISLAGLQSVISAEWRFFAFSIAGGVAAYGLSALMFYTGQWGGGDSKLLIGMGAVLGLPLSAAAPFVMVESEIVSFVFNFVAVSLAYAIIIGTVLALRNKKRFAAAFRKLVRSYSLFRKLLLAAAVLGLAIVIVSPNYLLRLGTVALLVSLFSGLYLSMMAKAVERSCMVRQVSPLRLTEGDWIASDVVVDGKRICGPKDLGVEKVQIRQLAALYRKGKIRAVRIKEGIPFAPSFLIAYLVTVFFGNLFFILLP